MAGVALVDMEAHAVVPCVMHVVVTAGPTREAIDPVRFISNRSSGKMGFAIAAALAGRGHRVTLIAGPVGLETPAGVERIDVISAADMARAVQDAFAGCDALIMAAAVADWRPARVSETKLKKQDMAAMIQLERTDDILMLVKPLRQHQVVVGFAAETADPRPEARRKLHAKGLDLVVANDLSAPDAGFAVDTNRVVLVSADEDERLPLLPKKDVAEILAKRVEALVGHVSRDS
jgi:phosphopantothenoylcysteine decarboxylase/phosphopantothenate--cysteine ligase